MVFGLETDASSISNLNVPTKIENINNQYHLRNFVNFL